MSIWANFDKRAGLLTKPIFSQEQATDISGLSSVQIKNAIVRGHVKLRRGNHPGTGRHIRFCGSDILKLVVMREMNRVGFPLRWVERLGDRVAVHAQSRIDGTALIRGLVIATYPLADGNDWAAVPVYDGMSDTPELPTATQMLQADRLIDQTLEKLRVAAARQAISNFDIVAPVMQAAPGSPQNDFFRQWTKDDNGRDVLIGLDFRETQEFETLKNLYTLDRSQDGDVQQALFSKEAGERMRLLSNKHEQARINTH